MNFFMHTNQNFGPNYLWRGLLMLKRRELAAYVWLPLVINVLFFVGLIWLGAHELGRFTQWINGFLPHWLHWLNWLLWLVGLIVGLLVLVYGFNLAANFIAAPFNGFLAEKVELLLTGKPTNNGRFWQALAKEAPYMIKQQWRLLVYYLPRAIICLALFFIPVVQVVAGGIWIIFHIWMMALQYLSYPMENHQLPFKEIKLRLRNHSTLSMSFGGVIMLMAMIPLINFLIMPAAVAGATILWVENNQLTTPYTTM